MSDERIPTTREVARKYALWACEMALRNLDQDDVSDEVNYVTDVFERCILAERDLATTAERNRVHKQLKGEGE